MDVSLLLDASSLNACAHSTHDIYNMLQHATDHLMFCAIKVAKTLSEDALSFRQVMDDLLTTLRAVFLEHHITVISEAVIIYKMVPPERNGKKSVEKIVDKLVSASYQREMLAAARAAAKTYAKLADDLRECTRSHRTKLRRCIEALVFNLEARDNEAHLGWTGDLLLAGCMDLSSSSNQSQENLSALFESQFQFFQALDSLLECLEHLEVHFLRVAQMLDRGFTFSNRKITRLLESRYALSNALSQIRFNIFRVTRLEVNYYKAERSWRMSWEEYCA